ncbi:hypothetical protein E2C01_023782 [Portunus trituberculatus]|uniref:Uncharacterized protein n=1 Tax=Portunus trituberculatus TaxID=210409 RepID=A0A5B7EBG9_PORTR|nr:hypothetical protein [Portunus trituberculatus]
MMTLFLTPTCHAAGSFHTQAASPPPSPPNNPAPTTPPDEEVDDVARSTCTPTAQKYWCEKLIPELAEERSSAHVAAKTAKANSRLGIIKRYFRVLTKDIMMSP